MKSHSIVTRIQHLRRLKQCILKHQELILQALYDDVAKPRFEAYTSEIVVCLNEIDLMINTICRWSQPQRVKTPFILMPGSSYIYPEPYGTVLIIAPWNFPVQLLLLPLIGALAAGNCAVLKPSEHAPHTSRLIKIILEQEFEPTIVSVVEGGIPETKALLAQKFDYIFFTGSTRVGKIVMHAAAEHLTPLTLELGGKNPCIVDADSCLDTAAKRIVWGKFYNAGQNCLSPNYLFVDTRIKAQLIERLQFYIQKFYNQSGEAMSRIINRTHFDRLVSLLNEGTIMHGGTYDAQRLRIEPTLIEGISRQSPLIQEEIFGPILPVLSYTDINEALTFIRSQPKPLALYIFSHNKKLQNLILTTTSSGSVAINDTVMQNTNPNLPFGGVGLSGFGNYHGKASFDTFSHYKSVMKKSCWFDIASLRYPPYGRLHRFLATIIRYF